MFRSIRSFFKTWGELQAYKKLPAQKRTFTVYSEGPQDWPHLGPMLVKFLDLNPNAHICYLSSEEADPGLSFDHPRFLRFFIGSGTTRTIFFKSADTKILLMTLPDLNVFELKKSIFPVHYVYAFHSINSTHIVYRERAFEFFDTLFCVGPHHVKELLQEEKLKSLPPRRLLEHGSMKLDSVLDQYRDVAEHRPGAVPFVLLAPSWGDCSFAEDVDLAKTLIKTICDQGWRCSLRLHPMTVRRLPKYIPDLARYFAKEINYKLFTIESDMNDNSSLMESDIMVSDWSGAATEYAFALFKPVLFLDTPQKVNNPNWSNFGTKGIEDFIRCEIGAVIKTNEVSSKLVPLVGELISDTETFKQKVLKCREQWIFNLGRSADVGAEHLSKIFEEYSK
jgi:hypothetical protein